MISKKFKIGFNEATFRFDENNYLMINVSEVSMPESSSPDRWIVDHKKEILVISRQFQIPEKHLITVLPGIGDKHDYWFHELLAMEYFLYNNKETNFKCWVHQNSIEMHALKNFDCIKLSRLDILKMALETEEANLKS